MNRMGFTAALLWLGACSSSMNTPMDSGAPPVDSSTADSTPQDTTAPDTAVPTDTAPRDGAPTPTGGACAAMLGACNPVVNTGCSMAGQACYLMAMMTGGSTAVCAAAGTREAGAACMSNTDCREGFVCLGMMGSTARSCVKMCCEGDNASCRDAARGGTPGSVCDRAVTISGTMIHVCQQAVTCDPLALMTNGCPTERPYCAVTSADGSLGCFAVGMNPGGEGTPCCMSGACQPGYLCIQESMGTCDNAMPNRFCRRVCNPMAAMSTCPAGRMCQGLMDRPPTYGACARM